VTWLGGLGDNGRKAAAAGWWRDWRRGVGVVTRKCLLGLDRCSPTFAVALLAGDACCAPLLTPVWMAKKGVVGGWRRRKKVIERHVTLCHMSALGISVDLASGMAQRACSKRAE